MQRVAPDVEFVGELPDGGPVVHRNLSRPAFGGAGLDQDHAVGAAGTVDGRGRGIFQDLDRFDVRGVDLRQVAGVADGESIDYDQRGVRTVERTVAADTHYGARPGILRSVHDLQSGGTALQQSLDRRGRDVLDGIHLHGNDRSGQVALFHAAITYDYHFVQHSIVRNKFEVQVLLSFQFDFLILVTNIADYQCCIIVCFDREFSVKVCDYTLLSILYLDGCSN